MTGFRSAHAPCFSHGVSASSDSETCYSRALTESVYDLAAPLHELLVSEVVLECVDEPVAPDAVIKIGHVSAFGSRRLVVEAGVYSRNQLYPGVVAPELLFLQLLPERGVLVPSKSILLCIIEPVGAAVVTATRDGWGRARHAKPGTAAAPSILGTPRAISFPRPLSTSGAVLELFIREFCSARVASESSFRPLGSQALLALCLALGVMVCARATKACGSSRSALRTTVLTEPCRDSSRLSRFIRHKASLPHVESGFSLWRWSETASLLERGGIR